MYIIALIIATVIPLFVLYIIYTRNLYATGEANYIAFAVGWGVLAFTVASLFNRILIDTGTLDRLTTVQFAAPVIEEILKGAFLLYLVRRPQFTYFVDGAIYGFSVGIGFAVFENYQYVFGNLNAALGIAIGRVISTNLMHATTSALLGIGFGLARFERGSSRSATVGLALTLAMVVHIGFNNLVTRVSSGYLLLYAAVVGVGGVFVILTAIKRGLAEEKLWIEEKLGMADRVTASEAAVVQRLDNLQQILEPLAARFGQEKAAQIEKFLLLQARLGILRKTLDKLQDEKLLEVTRLEITQKQQEMDEVRRAVGVYTMSYLRNIFPEGDSPLWGGLEGLIEQRLAAQPVDPGGGLWGRLEKRSEESPDPSAIG